jgi:2-isopropylmalate synthase
MTCLSSLEYSRGGRFFLFKQKEAFTMRKVHIFDTTLRDGEQAPGATLSAEQKIRVAEQLVRLGVDCIEPGFPISSVGEFESVRAISRMLNGTGVEICGFARAVKGDIDRAVEATAEAERRRLHLFLSSSDIHLDFQLKKSRQEVIRMAREHVAYAKQFVDRIEYSPMDATRTGMEFLLEMTEAVISEGATIINVPDTVGFALPEEYGSLFRRLRKEVHGGDTVEYSAHCHNDLGLAVANSLAAIQAGVSYVEVTVNGVGERAGNCSLEELVMAIETRKDTLGVETGIRLEELYETSRLVSRAMSFPIAFNKPIVGRNAFQHEAGIHQDGLLKNRSTYEIMNPEALGIPRSMIVLGKHSGRHAIKHRVAGFGVDLNAEQLECVYTEFKQLADVRKTVTDAELGAIAGAAAGVVVERFTVEETHVAALAGGLKTAAVTVRDALGGALTVTHGTGTGPVEAVVAALKAALPVKLQFADLELYSLSSGEDASGEAIVTAASGGTSYRGFAVDQDIVFAVAKAYIAAANVALRDGKSFDAGEAENKETMEMTKTITRTRTEGAEPQWTLP